VVRWFLDADDNPDSYQKPILLLFGLFTMFLEICMQIYSVVFASSRQINNQKVCENSQFLLCR